jgi:DNA polymerase-3 subunit delta'
MKKGRLAHAYLFYGTKGLGKQTAAEIFAKALNCTGADFDACDGCSSCLKIDHGNHSDIIMLKPEGQFIRIHEIREIQEQMRFKPFEGGKRVFIVEDAEKMNIPAANALLKTLEEPSPANILILLSSRPHQLPMTILSRCQKLRFNPLSRKEIAGYLAAKMNLDEATAKLLATTAGGSIGKALEMYEESYLSTRDDILKRVVQFYGEDPLNLLWVVDALGKDRDDILQRLDILKTWHRDVLIYRETGDAERLFHSDQLETVKFWSRSLSVSEILDNISVIGRASNAIDRNANKQLTLETLLFKLTRPHGSVDESGAAFNGS